MINIEDIKFQSYCWSIGTTSFRVKDLNFRIEKQLQLLKLLWEQNPGEIWNGNNAIQEKYYNIMKEANFVKGEASNKPKGAREKTSGIVQIGVINDSRRITEVGNKIIDIVQNNDFRDDNIFNINKDSYIYLKQLLKLQNTSNGLSVKPFIVLLYALSELKYLTKEEFTYILPLCRTNEEAIEIVKMIEKYRDNQITIDEIIYQKMSQMNNYKTALTFMLKNDINTIDEFSVIDMNRKGKKYGKSLYNFYIDLYEIIMNGMNEDGLEKIAAFIKEQVDKNSKVGSYWKNYFNYSRKTIFSEEYKEEIENSPIFKISNKEEYNREFFRLMHTAKWRSNLEDYADLNKRYISLSDVVIFGEDRIELELFPKYYFLNISNQLLATPVLNEEEYSNFFEKDIDMEEIYDCLNIDVNSIINQIKVDYPNSNIEINTIKTFIKDERLSRFNKLINSKFNDDNLVYIYNCIEKDDRKLINEFADWEADVPTIFEYILAITWYKLSNRTGNILEFMKLSLDANLYPKTHAGGGTADIVYEYQKSNKYEAHKALLEATLTESTSQRKNEMEPVSRHLIRELQENPNKNTYAIFVANILNEETLSDFRSRRHYQYRNNSGNIENGLKIISLSIEDIRNIIIKKITYSVLYELLDNAYNDTEINDIEWYEHLIKNKINNL